MKKEVKLQSKVKGLGENETPENNPQLIHYLSPLELAAYKHPFQAFTYYLEGETLHIETHIARQIYYTSRKHVAVLRSILQRSRQKTLKQDVQIRRFLNLPLKNHGLPTRVYHVLRQNDCQNLADVANKGETELKRMRGMGKDSMRLIMNLFIDNGCGSLFL